MPIAAHRSRFSSVRSSATTKIDSLSLPNLDLTLSGLQFGLCQVTSFNGIHPLLFMPTANSCGINWRQPSHVLVPQVDDAESVLRQHPTCLVEHPPQTLQVLLNRPFTSDLTFDLVVALHVVRRGRGHQVRGLFVHEPQGVFRVVIDQQTHSRSTLIPFAFSFAAVTIFCVSPASSTGRAASIVFVRRFRTLSLLFPATIVGTLPPSLFPAMFFASIESRSASNSFRRFICSSVYGSGGNLTSDIFSTNAMSMSPRRCLSSLFFRNHVAWEPPSGCAMNAFSCSFGVL